MTLYEKRITFKKQLVALNKQEQFQPWYLRLNPRAEVPVLTDGVKVIPDSVRIIEYLEDNFSNGTLMHISVYSTFPVDVSIYFRVNYAYMFGISLFQGHQGILQLRDIT